METDSFFYQLFKQLPQTLFELIGLPAARANSYRFDSVEVKKSLRIDGLFLPRKARLPLYFVEVQFQRLPTFYANLFAKVFSYLEENDPKQDWIAVAIFASRKEEPKHLRPYEELLKPERVKRIYLDEHITSENPPLGLGLLQLLFASEKRAEQMGPRIMEKVETELADSDLQARVIELLERLLMSRFVQHDREALRMKFKLHNIRESKVWQEAHQEGKDEGLEKGLEKGIEKGETRKMKEIIDTLRAKRKTLEEISALLDIPLDKLRKMADNHSN